MVAAGKNCPEFIDAPPAEVKVGEYVIAYVEEGNDGWRATIWGSYNELTEAERIVESNISKPAPEVPALLPFTPAGKKPTRAPRRYPKVAATA